MFLLSSAWWLSKLSGIAVQAMMIVAVVAVVIGGLAWLRHDAVLQERAAAAARMEKARSAQLLVLRRREKDAMAVGKRAEVDLLRELDALTALNNDLEAKLASRPPSSKYGPAGRMIVYPRDVVRELNR